MTTAPEILQAGIGHMQDRASTYDKPEGERSMGSTVAAFNAVTGDGRMDTEERGWLFMLLLKAVRCQQGGFKLDNYEDGAAYFGLMGEAASNERKRKVSAQLSPCHVCGAVWDGPCGFGGNNRCARQQLATSISAVAPDYPAVEVGVDVRFDQSGRQEAVEQNGNDGAVYEDLKEAKRAKVNRGLLQAHDDILVNAMINEPERPRHQCRACGLGHATHECTGGLEAMPLAELAIQQGGKPIGDCERCQGRVIQCDGHCDEGAE